MKKLYFFKSSNSGDLVGVITVFTTTITKAYALALKAFARCNYRGNPVMLAV